MTLRFHWRLIDGGEGPGPSLTGRHAASRGLPDLDALVRFCRDAERAGIDSLLLDFGFSKPDPMTLAAALCRRTERIKFMVACRPGLMSPTLFVQQVNTVSALAGGRISLNVVAGHSAEEMATYGASLDHDARYERMDEFLAVCRAFWESDDPVEFSGRHYQFRGGRLRTPFVAAGSRAPEVYVGGTSPAAREVAASRADCWVRFPLAPARLTDEIRPVLGAGRQVGLRLGVVARPTRGEALAAAGSLVEGAGASAGELRAFVGRSDSHSLRSIDELAATEWLTPRLWTGTVPALGVPNVCLLGSYDEVAGELAGLGELGVGQFILSGWPKWDEMVRFGSEVIPRVRALESRDAGVAAASGA